MGACPVLCVTSMCRMASIGQLLSRRLARLLRPCEPGGWSFVTWVPACVVTAHHAGQLMLTLSYALQLEPYRVHTGVLQRDQLIAPCRITVPPDDLSCPDDQLSP